MCLWPFQNGIPRTLHRRSWRRHCCSWGWIVQSNHKDLHGCARGSPNSWRSCDRGNCRIAVPWTKQNCQEIPRMVGINMDRKFVGSKMFNAFGCHQQGGNASYCGWCVGWENFWDAERTVSSPSHNWNQFDMDSVEPDIWQYPQFANVTCWTAGFN